MKTRFFEGIKVSFNDFPEEMQKKFYEAKKDEFREEASKSQFASIRKLVAEDEETSNEFLNEMLREEVTKGGKQNFELISVILSKQKFTMEEETRKTCAESINPNYRCIAVSDGAPSSEYLNAMLREEITNKDKKSKIVIQAILIKEKLLLQEDLRNACAEFDAWEIRLLIARDPATPKELLETMRKKESDQDVLESIEKNLSHKEEVKKKEILELLKGFIPSEDEAVECLEKLKAII